MNNRRQGIENRRLGIVAERMAKSFYERKGCSVIRIEDGGFVTKDKIFIRRKQFCDFIIFLPAPKEDQIIFIDVKKKPDKRITPSYFNNEKSSTYKQYNNFLKIEKWHIINCFFHFVNIDYDLHYKLPINKNIKFMNEDKLIELEDVVV